MIYFLWAMTALLLLFVMQARVGNPRWLFRRIFDFVPVKSKHMSLFKKITKTCSSQKHSWLTHKCSPQLSVKKRLQNAGDPISYFEYLHVKEMIIRIFSFLLFFFLLFGNPTWKNCFLFIFYFSFFFFFLDFVLQIMKEKREKLFTRQVPYFIDLFILTLRTGLNIEQTLWCLTKKESLLAHTIRRRLEGLNLGRSLNEIFIDLEADVNNEEFQHFLRSVRQSQVLGVSLAYTLEIQSQLIRTKRKQRAEEISRTAAVKISLPLVLFIFPALLIIYIGPGILNIL